MTLTPKQRLAMLVDEDELPKKPSSPPPAPEQEPEPWPEPALTSESAAYFCEDDDESDDGIHRGPKHNDRRMNADLREHFTRPSTNHTPPASTSTSSMTTMTENALPQPNIAVGTATSGSFCPIMAISKFPYKYIRHPTTKQNVASGFFDSGKFWSLHWDLYYVWPPSSASVKPIVLISRAQAEALIKRINQKLRASCPSLDKVDKEHGVCLDFNDPHPSFQPRYLGRCTSRAEFTSLENAIPGQPYRPAHEVQPTDRPTEEAQTHFTRLLEYATEISRSGKTRKGAKMARLNDRLDKQQNSTKSFEQAERFFGLRAPPPATNDAVGPEFYESWAASPAPSVAEEASRNPAPIHPLQAVPHPFDSEPILIAIDIEAWERAPSRITEIGISTLDTRDFVGIAPGWFAQSWRSLIRSRHIRIVENAHLHNSQFVQGNAGGFRFGKSEMVHEADVTGHIATFFRPPFSKIKEGAGEDEGEADDEDNVIVEAEEEEEEKRTIVLVGHGFDNDLKYLQGLGYNPLNLLDLHPTTPILDTQHLYRTLTTSRDPVSLARILQALDITPWGLHNAGNDARYTLEVLMGVLVGSATRRRGGLEGVFETVEEGDVGEVVGTWGGNLPKVERGDEEGGVSLGTGERDEKETERQRIRDLRRGFPSFSVAPVW